MCIYEELTFYDHLFYTPLGIKARLLYSHTAQRISPMPLLLWTVRIDIDFICHDRCIAVIDVLFFFW